MMPHTCALPAHWFVGLPFVLPVSGILNSVMWTLVVEVQFYVVLPLVFLALRKIPAKVCLWLIPSLFLSVPLVFRLCTGLHAAFSPAIDPHFPSTLDAFCFGILVAGLDARGELDKRWAWLGTAGIILWLFALPYAAWRGTHYGWPAPMTDNSAIWLEKIASGCVLFYVLEPKRPLARLLCTPLLRWTGLISYEWYLFHQPIIVWTHQIFGFAHGNVAKYVAIVGGPILLGLFLSALIYRYFSLPILRYGRARK